MGDSSELAPVKAQKSRFFKRSKPQEPRNEHVGARAEVKTFYEGPPLEDGPETQTNWVEWQPPTIPEAKKVKWEGYAIQIYKVPETNQSFGNVATFKVSFIYLLSPHIRDQLKDVLKFHGVTWDKDIASISWPLEPLYFAREKIAELSKVAKEEQVRAHLEQLCKVINDELGPTIDQVEDLEKNDEITHALVWTLFPKGTIVIKKDTGNEKLQLAYRVVKSTGNRYSSSHFDFKAEYIKFDGIRYRFESKTFYIPYFEGKKPINSLLFYPIDAATDAKLLKEQLCTRGRKALDFQGIEYMRYQELGEEEQEVPDDPENDFTTNSIQTRVIIDPFGYNKRYSAYGGELLPGYKNVEEKDIKDSTGDPYALEPPRHHGPSVRRPGDEQQKENRKVVCEDEVYHLIMSPYLGGFSLSTKRWKNFHIDKIFPLHLTEEAYNHLVHPERNKDLVCSLVQHHKEHPKHSDDVIAGKGRGLLVLLSGPPGTGKTLLAEAVADKTRLPLYYVDANEMGTPDRVNSTFDDIMSNAADWSAIILLDEADIYLQRRSEKDLTRNEIVATLLRRLEYYQGIMFLTTNLYETIDLAVESRLHIHLRFLALPFSSRVQIWSNFLTRLRASPVLCGKISEDEIRELAMWTLNGRDIKNALKMTVSWCQQKGSKVTFMAIEDVIQATCPRASKEEVKVNGLTNGVNGEVGSALSHRHEMEELLDL